MLNIRGLEKEKAQIRIVIAKDIQITPEVLAEIKHKAIEPIRHLIETWELDFKTRYVKNGNRIIRKTKTN
jgi:hypothetical protein|tara:strand:- start:2039 stop:2248 length:210 start_codon:yes stop_codon:yes gene_type:complete